MFGYFFENYFSVNLKDYNNIGIDLPINKVLMAVFLSMCAVCIVIHVHKRNMYRLLKQMSRHCCFDENGAKTLKELGLADNLFIKKSLSSDTSIINKIVRRVGKVTLTYEEYAEAEKRAKINKRMKIKEENSPIDEKVDFETARFYIPDEKQLFAKRTLENSNVSLLHTLLFCLLVIVVYICLAFLMPSLLSWINGIIIK